MVTLAPGIGDNRGQVLSITAEAGPIKQHNGTSGNLRRFIQDCVAYCRLISFIAPFSITERRPGTAEGRTFKGSFPDQRVHLDRRITGRFRGLRDYNLVLNNGDRRRCPNAAHE